jgi:hypothetical protein
LDSNLNSILPCIYLHILLIWQLPL